MTNARKIKKIGDFYVTKVRVNEHQIHGIYFDKKYERLIKLKDRQAYIWFMLFAILETVLRSYIFEIVIALTALIIIANLAFYIFFIKRENITVIQLADHELYEVVDKKHRAWRQTFTMALVFVCMARLLLFIQPGVFSDDKVTIIYCISLIVSFFTIIMWIYYGSIKNRMKLNKQYVVKKRGVQKSKRMKYTS